MKRNHGRTGTIDRNAPDLAVVGGDNLSGVGRERHPWESIASRHRFLVVTLHGIHQPSFIASFEVAQPQAGLGLKAGRVDKPLAVGRQRGANR